MIRIPGAVVLVSLAIRRKHHVQTIHTEMIALRFPLSLSLSLAMIDKTDRLDKQTEPTYHEDRRKGGVVPTSPSHTHLYKLPRHITPHKILTLDIMIECALQRL